MKREIFKSISMLRRFEKLPDTLEVVMQLYSRSENKQYGAGVINPFFFGNFLDGVD